MLTKWPRALLGQMKLPKSLAEKAGRLFGLSKPEMRMPNEVPSRGGPMPPTDPLIYRFYELAIVNGPALESADRGGIRRRHHVRERSTST